MTHFAIILRQNGGVPFNFHECGEIFYFSIRFYSMLLLTSENSSHSCRHEHSHVQHNIEIYRWTQLLSPFSCHAHAKGNKIIACEKMPISVLLQVTCVSVLASPSKFLISAHLTYC